MTRSLPRRAPVPVLLLAAAGTLGACTGGGDPTDDAASTTEATAASATEATTGADGDATTSDTVAAGLGGGGLDAEIVLDAMPLRCEGTDVSITSELYRDEWFATIRDTMACRYEFRIVNVGDTLITLDEIRFRGLAGVEEVNVVTVTPWNNGEPPTLENVGADLHVAAGHRLENDGEIRFELELTSTGVCRTFEQAPISLRPFVEATVRNDVGTRELRSLGSSLVLWGGQLTCEG